MFRHILSLTCVPLVVVGALSLASANAPAEISVMTYNLRYANAGPLHSWTKRRPVARELIQTFKPDLIGTQEGLYQQVKDLDADLPDYAWIGLGREGGSRGEFMAVFYRSQRFEPLDFDHFWLSETPGVIASKSWGSSLPRMVTWVRFRHRESQTEFIFANTHFDHRSQTAREKSAELVLEISKKVPAKTPILLAGDFNAIADASKAYETLVNPDAFSDTWIAAETRGDPVGTFHGYRGPTKNGPRIDWILSRGPVKTIHTEVVTFQKDGQYPSDHFPVIARIVIN